MTISDINTYEDIDTYCKERGYEKLTDKQIKTLCDIVWKICDREIKYIKATEKNPYLAILSITAANNAAAVKCHNLRNCTEERRNRNISAELDRADQYGTKNPSDTAHMTEKEKTWERTIH